MSHACLVCGHDCQQHAPEHAPKGTQCCVQGCTCPKFDPATDHPTAMAGPTPGVWEQVEDALPHLGPGALSPEAQQQVEQVMAGPTPDLQQAIHAATNALLLGPDDYDSTWNWQDVARIAVEAAWPYAIGSATQHHWKRTAVNKMEQLQAAQAEVTQTQDRAHRLEVEVKDLEHRLGVSDNRRANLETQTQQDIARLQAFVRAVRDAFNPDRWCGFDGLDGASKEEVLGDIGFALLALELAAQRKDPQ